MKLKWEGKGKSGFVQDVKSFDVYDYDGNGYNEVIIGTQTWLVENLRTSKDVNGVSIPLETTDTTHTTPAYRIMNNNASNEFDDYGCLYNISCRSKTFIEGYHVPTKAEFQILDSYVASNCAFNLRSTGTTYWDNSNGLDSVGFDLRGGGRAVPYFDKFKIYFYLWTSDFGFKYNEYTQTTCAYYDDGTSDSYYVSIRLIKDS